MYTFGEGDLSSGVHVVILGVQNQVKEKSQAGGLGLDVGHKDRTRINLSCLRLHFLRFDFLYLQVSLFT